MFYGNLLDSPINEKYKNSNEQRNDVTKKDQIFSILMGGGERCQALECGRARYLPSLISLFCYALFTHTGETQLSNFILY